MTAMAPCAATQERFAIGHDLRGFLSVLDEGRIAEAEKSLNEMLGQPPHPKANNEFVFARQS
jgi:hypothetical protein